ncbi:MAG: amino acid ABC transporter substrate-binding protein [Syntrophobacteraceae bacterium]|nr:amino acid ABC transporter substrate-binding protein [Syntrophobacteraceae bacterium]
MSRRMFWATTVLVSLISFSTTTAAAPPLRIAYPTFPPFHFIDANGAMAGFFYEIMTTALHERMGLSVSWEAYPWARCQENVKFGKEDAIITVPTRERLHYTSTHKDPFYNKTLNIFINNANPRIAEIMNLKTISDIKKSDFSVITYSGNGWHKENVEILGIKTHETPSLENVWKMLAGMRGDLVIEWPHGAWPDIKRAGVIDEIIDTQITISSMPFHLLIKKTSPSVNILDQFNETINKMKEDGTMQLILSRYY